MTAPARLPEGFVGMLASLGLSDVADAIAATAPEVSVRINPRKPAPALSTPGHPVAWWAERGLTLDSRPRFTLDPALHQGRYYVQEAGSMFAARVVSSLVGRLGSASRLCLLDACAAPGGKTTAAIDALPDGSIVVANEFVPLRAAVLRENLVKWGYPYLIVTRGDTEPYSRLRDTFDIILADVPCSGEGMMRKDADAVAQWSESLVAECASLQRSILSNLWPSLRPGGFLVYSTCTLNRTENEEQLLAFMAETGAESVALDVDPSWGVTPALDAPGLHACRFLPGRTPTEGLFVSVLRKPGADAGTPPVESAKGRRAEKRPAEASAVEPWIAAPEEMVIRKIDDRLSALPASMTRLLARIERLTDVICAGVQLATVKGRDLIPAHPLAMSTLLRPDAFPRVELSRDEALDYLRGNALTLPASTPRGYVLPTFDGFPLGFAKHLGNRSNNLYPSPWRVKITS